MDFIQTPASLSIFIFIFIPRHIKYAHNSYPQQTADHYSCNKCYHFPFLSLPRDFIKDYFMPLLYSTTIFFTSSESPHDFRSIGKFSIASTAFWPARASFPSRLFSASSSAILLYASS